MTCWRGLNAEPTRARGDGVSELAPDDYTCIFCSVCGNRIGWLNEDYNPGVYLCDECAKEKKEAEGDENDEDD